MNPDAWIDVLGSFDGAPRIGEDPLSAADLEYRIAVTDTTALNKWFTFQVTQDEDSEPT